MLKNQFKEYMKKQIDEIKRYREIKMCFNLEIDTNQCVFEWVEKYADEFRKEWERDNNN